MGRVYQRGQRWVADYRDCHGKRCQHVIKNAKNQKQATRELHKLIAGEDEAKEALAQGLWDPRSNRVEVGPLLEGYLLHQLRTKRYGTVLASRIALGDTMGCFHVVTPGHGGRAHGAPNPHGPRQDCPLMWPPRFERPLEQIEATPREFVPGPLDVERVDQLSPARVEAWAAARRKEGYAQRTIDIRFRTVKALLNWAVAERRIRDNPVARAKLGIKVPKGRWRALIPAEVEELLAASPEPYRTIWLALASTGMRRGELVNLVWADVSFVTNTIRVRAETSKSARMRDITMTAYLRERLQKLAGETPDPAAPVFPNAAGRPWLHNLDARFRGCCRKAGLHSRLERSGGKYFLVYRDGSGPTVREQTEAKTSKEAEELRRERSGYQDGRVVIHSMRHTFATELLRQGVAPKIVSELLGHTSIKTTLDIYAHYLPQDRQTAVEKLSYGRGASERVTKGVTFGQTSTPGEPQVIVATGTWGTS